MVSVKNLIHSRSTEKPKLTIERFKLNDKVGGLIQVENILLSKGRHREQSNSEERLSSVQFKEPQTQRPILSKMMLGVPAED